MEKDEMKHLEYINAIKKTIKKVYYRLNDIL